MAGTCKEKIVYHHAGLPFPGDLGRQHRGFLNLGSFVPDEFGPEVVAEVMGAYIGLVERSMDGGAFRPENRHLFVAHGFITLERYLRTYREFRGFSRETTAAEGLLNPESREIKKDLAERRNPFSGLDGIGERLKADLRRHFGRIDRATPESYYDLLQEAGPPIGHFFAKPLPLLIEERQLQRHVLITGNSGAGKSTLLKRLIRVCSRNEDASIVVVDPAGTLAREVAQFPEFADAWAERLIYLDPSLAPDRTPVFNPLDIADRNETAVHIATEEIVRTFEELLKDGNGSDLSLNMRAILYPCVTTLIHEGGKTFFDLQAFLMNDAALIEEGRRSPHDAVRAFFHAAFGERKFEVTKLSLYTKLQSLLNSPIFARMIARPSSSINLEGAINSGKIIVLNLAKGAMGAETSEALGRFFIASLKSIVQKRWNDNGRHRPVFLIVDEVQNYVSPSIIEILRESRKYGLHLVASTQFISDMARDMQDAFLSVTNVKITGKNSVGTLSVMAKETGAPLERLQSLRQGVFSIKVDTAKPLTVTVPPPEAQEAGEGHWERTKQRQLERYYLPLERPDATPEPAEPDRPKYEL